MNRTTAIAWVVSACACYLRRSQAKTLGVLVAAAMRTQRVSLAALGRQMSGLVKHQIKRTWRFIGNDRVETADAMRGVVGRLVRKRKKALLVSFDWTDLRGCQTLMAAAVIKGRAVPLCWASCRKHVYDGHRSRNAFEESLLLVLRDMIPQEVKIILLADRGFGRTALARFCRDHHFSYVIRISPKVCVQLKGTKGYRGKLLDYPVRRGIAKVLRDVLYRREESVVQNVVVRWKPHLPEDRDECWFLMTDLSGTARQLCRLYGRRMTIEELFRDSKSRRNGWSLRDTGLRRPERIDRLLLILALAYLLLCGIGLLAQQRHRPSAWCSNNRDNECSIFAIGRTMLDRLRLRPGHAFNAVLTATEAAGGNWG